MSTRNVINSNFYQIANADANLNVTGVTTSNVNATVNLNTANLTANSTVTLGNIANVKIAGGANGQANIINISSNSTLAVTRTIQSQGS